MKKLIKTTLSALLITTSFAATAQSYNACSDSYKIRQSKLQMNTPGVKKTKKLLSTVDRINKLMNRMETLGEVSKIENILVGSNYETFRMLVEMWHNKRDWKNPPTVIQHKDLQRFFNYIKYLRADEILHYNKNVHAIEVIDSILDYQDADPLTQHYFSNLLTTSSLEGLVILDDLRKEYFYKESTLGMVYMINSHMSVPLKSGANIDGNIFCKLNRQEDAIIYNKLNKKLIQELTGN